MRVILAVGLVTSVMHQRLADVKAMGLPELYTWAHLAAAMSGRKFE